MIDPHSLILYAPYVAAAVALLVGITAPVVTAILNRRSTRETLQAQRELANTDRLWQKRAATYEELLTWAGTVRGEAHKLLDDSTESLRSGTYPLSDLVRDLRAYDLEFPTALEARLAAYSSGIVYTFSRGFVATLTEMVHAFATGLDQNNESLLTRANNAHIDVANRMTQAISDDLHGVGVHDDGRPAGTLFDRYEQSDPEPADGLGI